MSGGHFDYKQYEIQEISESIKLTLKRQGLLKPKCEVLGDGDDPYYPVYPKSIQTAMWSGVRALQRAWVYAQRIDFFLSGDDAEEDFLRRLEEELKDIT